MMLASLVALALSGGTCPEGPEHIVPLGGGEARLGSPRLLASASGFDLFLGTSAQGLSAWHVALDQSGAMRGAPLKVHDGGIYFRLGRGDDGRVAAIAPGRPIIDFFDVGAGHVGAKSSVVVHDEGGVQQSTVWAAWSPRERVWGVVSEHLFAVPGRGAHVRLFFRRVAADGSWLGGAIALTREDTSLTAQLSDWGAPLLWDGDAFRVIVSTTDTARGDALVLTRIGPGDAVSHTSIARASAGRTALASDGKRLALAWGEHRGDHYEVRFTTVEGDVVQPPSALGREGLDSNGPLLVYDGATFVVAFSESRGLLPHQSRADPRQPPSAPPPSEPLPGSRLRVLRLDPATRARVREQVLPDRPGDHSTALSLAWNGCQHAVGFLSGPHLQASGLWLFP